MKSPRSTSRRGFLADAGSLALGSVILPSFGTRELRIFAEPHCGAPARRARPPTLIAVFLRGGNDALNTVIPYGNKTYYDLRPRISIPVESTADEPGVVKLTDKMGLHPAMAALKPFWDKKQLAAIASVGSPHPTRSHFDAQDFMEYASPGDRTLHQGWLNRWLAETHVKNGNQLRALAMQGLLPRSLRGKQPVLAVPELRAQDSEGLLDLFDDVYKEGGAMGGEMVGAEKMSGGAEAGRDEAVAVGRETIETLRRFWEIVDKEPEGGSKATYPKSQFAARLKTIARVIRNDAGLEVAALDYGGWDHHQNEGASDGAIQRDLKGLSDALAAFATDLGPSLERVVVLVMTEFGRTAAENGNRGTDHGRGGMMLALGGPVNGGRIIGDYGPLDAKHLADGRDLPVEIDFRAVFAETLHGLFDFKIPKGFFPLYTPKDTLGLLRKS